MTTIQITDPIEIPIALDTPLWDERTTLDGREYLIRLDWNGREGRWYLSLETVDGIQLMRGVKIVSNWPLLRRLVAPEAPPGPLIAQSFSPDTSPPGFYDLGRRVRLLYFPQTVT
jgi:hypothetical protein